MEEAQERTELHVLHTSCKDCVFAEYEMTSKASTLGVPVMTKTQVGCHIGRLDKYRAQGAEIVQAYDDEAEFEIVDGRSCPAFRHHLSEWAKKVHPDNRADAVRQEMTIRTDVLVILISAGDVDHMQRTFDSLKKLALKPSSVVVLNNGSGVKMGKLVATLNKVAGGLNWNVVDVVEKRADGSPVDLSRCIDIAVPKMKGHFYTILLPGDQLPEKFTAELDKAVVDEMGRFVILEPNSNGVGLTVSLGFHKAPMINGNKAVPAAALEEGGDEHLLLTTVTEKAKYLAEKMNSPHLVAKAEDVCPSLA